jgi:cytochrome c oxidase subunit 2
VTRSGGRVRRLAGLGALAVLTVTLLSACSVDQAFSFGWPAGITDRSRQMYDLWVGSVIAALIVGVFVWGLIFWCVVRYRKRGEELPPQTRFNLPIEILYTVVPFLVISVLFYYTAVVETAVDKQPANPDVTVDVNPFKWNWHFSYRNTFGPDGQQISTLGADQKPVDTLGTSDYVPVLVVPTHKTIRFVEESRDVIHSFWVPELLFKRDAFPGNVKNSFAVTIEKEGAYVGRCAELCGTYHSMMNFELRAVSWSEYLDFIKAKRTGLSTPDALRAAGDKDPYATTTKPFNTDPASRTAS